jgi:hypothetical protein
MPTPMMQNFIKKRYSSIRLLRYEWLLNSREKISSPALVFFAHSQSDFT